MHSLFLLFFIPIVNTLVIVKIHRDSLYYPQSTCAFIRNASFSNGASIQSCIWECEYEYNCLTAVYYKKENNCSMYAESVETGRIQSSGNLQASVICYRKNHDPIVTCPSSTTLNHDDKEETTISGMMTTTSQNLKDIVLLTGTNETVHGVWNTTAGGDSTVATPGNNVGNYVAAESPTQAFDRDVNTKYTSFDACDITQYSLDCGLHTGFYPTRTRGPSLVVALQFWTANDNEQRDPLTMTIEGSNQTPSMLTLGSSWIPIYNGTTGLDGSRNRLANGTKISFPNNSIWYSSYRLLITSKRNISKAVQYSEVQFFGY